MNLILLSTLESIVESRTRLRADRAGAMILHHTFFLGTGFTFTSISPPVQSAQAAPHQAARFTPPASDRVVTKLKNYSVNGVKLKAGTPVGYIVMQPFSLN